MWWRRLKSDDRAPGWGNPGRGPVHNKDLKIDLFENLHDDIGIKVSEIDYEDGEIFYKSEKAILKIAWVYESTRDINNEEYLSINFHELIIFHYLQLGQAKEDISFFNNNAQCDTIAWMTLDELETILNREEYDNCITGETIKFGNKARKKERITYAQLEPFYPNNLWGEGITKEDYNAYRFLLGNIDNFWTDPSN